MEGISGRFVSLRVVAWPLGLGVIQQRIEVELLMISNDLIKILPHDREHRLGNGFDLLVDVVLTVDRVRDSADWLRTVRRHHVAD